MTKKITTLKVDENILFLAKREIPNISKFLEDCLKTYLDINNEDNVAEIQESLDTIRELKLKIHLLSENENNQLKTQAFDTEKQNKSWIKIWAKYRNGEETTISKGDEITLGLKLDELTDLMDTLLNFLPKSELPDCNDWETAKAKFEELK